MNALLMQSFRGTVNLPHVATCPTELDVAGKELRWTMTNEPAGLYWTRGPIGTSHHRHSRVSAEKRS